MNLDFKFFLLIVTMLVFGFCHGVFSDDITMIDVTYKGSLASSFDRDTAQVFGEWDDDGWLSGEVLPIASPRVSPVGRCCG